MRRVGEAQCSQCPGNKIVNAEQSGCEPCPVGKVPSVDQTKCICQLGTISNGTDHPDAICLVCLGPGNASDPDAPCLLEYEYEPVFTKAEMVLLVCVGAVVGLVIGFIASWLCFSVKTKKSSEGGTKDNQP